jgi:hypothetical protein
VQLLGTPWLTPGTAGTPDVNVKLAGGTAWASGAIVNGCFGTSTSLGSIRSGTLGAGGTSSVTLDNASSTNDYYKGRRISFISGTGLGQTALITAYNGTTKVATLHTALATATDATTTFTIDHWAGVYDVVLADTVTTVTNQLTAAQIATGVWQDSTAGDFTTASSIGKALYVANVAPGGSGGHMIAGSNAATTFASVTCTGAFLVSGGTTLTNGAGNGVTMSSTNSGSSGLYVGGSGAGQGVYIVGGTTGKGLHIQGGGSGGDAVVFDSQSTGSGLVVTAAGGTSGMYVDKLLVADTTTLTGAVTASNASNNIVGIDVAKLSGDSAAADNAESFFDGTGYAGANNVIPLVTTVTTLTNKTGFSLASTGLDLPLAADIDETKVGKTLMAAFNAMRAQGFGKWAISGTTLNLYANDNTTIVKAFTLDSSSAPTSRS